MEKIELDNNTTNVVEKVNNEEVSESEINSFIDYVLQYAYIPSVMSDDEEADPVILTYEDLTDELVVEITEGEYTNIADYREYIKVSDNTEKLYDEIKELERLLKIKKELKEKIS